MSDALEKTVAKIERLVLERKRNLAHAAIVAYVRKCGKSHAAKLKAARWCLRVGLYEQGYKIVTPRASRISQAAGSVSLTREFLWSALFLNLMGASDFAAAMIRGLSPADQEGHSVMGTIHLSRSDYRAGLRCYRQMEKAKSDGSLDPYRLKIHRIALCDCLAGAGDPEGALRKLATIRAEPSERLLQGILYQAEAEYRLALGQFDRALDLLERAEPLYPEGDRSPDRGYLLRWRGFALGKQGKTAAAKKSIDQAREILNQPFYRDEMFLECLKAEQELGWLSSGEEAFLYGFPGVPEGFWTRHSPPERVLFPDESADPSRFDLKVYLDRNEIELRGERSIRPPKELLLLAFVALTGEQGLSLERAKTLLWPGDFASYLQLEGRIKQLLRQLRKRHGVVLDTRDGRIRVRKNPYRLWIERRRGPAPWTFAESKPRFTGREFAEYYGVSKVYAWKLLGEEVREGRLRKEGEFYVTARQ